MKSGFAVIGDTQHLPGYSLLLAIDPSTNHLTDLDWPQRKDFPIHAYSDEKHGELRTAIAAQLGRLMQKAY